MNMEKIKFGTDGWRAIIGQDYTTDNVARVSLATAKWLLMQKKNPSVVIGHDCRFGGELFAETAAKVFCKKGIKVYFSRGISSTPMVSLGTVRLNADLGIVITASHNPASYNGYKLKGSYGGPLLPEKVAEIETFIPAKNSIDLKKTNLTSFMEKQRLEYVDLETMYCEHVTANFDLDAIRTSGLRFAYDAMFGAGQNVIRRLLPETALLHCEENPSFKGISPEPIHKNLHQLSNFIRNSGNIDCALATDGDADRIGLYDNDGNFIDSHHLILLLIKYLVEEKGFRGKVATAFSVSSRIGKLCRHYGLEQEVTKIGFKYIAGIMIKEDVLLGGEESGGIAIKGHIPERDGIWMGLTIWEYMAKSGKSLQQLIRDIYEIVGEFAFERSDLHLQEHIKDMIVANCEKNLYQRFGNYEIQRTETTDGYKYFFSDDEWLMIRASGTEPVLRNYVEASNMQNATSILKAAQETLLNEK
jgi:phosphomannomutase